jgi:hypothetical protein
MPLVVTRDGPSDAYFVRWIRKLEDRRSTCGRLSVRIGCESTLSQLDCGSSFAKAANASLAT